MSKPWQDADTLRRLYWDERLGQVEIGERLGCSTSCVQKWMDRLGIERRTSGPHAHPVLQDEEELTELYHGKNLSKQRIADRLGVSEGSVKYWMNEHEIQARSQAEAVALSTLLDTPYYGTNDEGYEKWQVGVDYERHTVAVHRLVAVAEYGIDAVTPEVDVHHKNGIPWDNRPQNLELIEHGEHARLHREMGKA